MKKILLLIVCVGLLIGVSYLKSVRQQNQTAAAYEKGKRESATKTTEDIARIDSLNTELDQQNRELAQSIWMREMAYYRMYDSLVNINETEGMTTDSGKGLRKSLSGNEQANTNEDDSPADELSADKQILSFYKKRYQSLPKDLSPYEMKVALTEIREETAREFAISLDKLDKIRIDNKLDY